MDATTKINNNLDVEKLLNHYNFENINSDGSYTRACCKMHNGNNPTAFVINNETGLWYCHTNCGGGDIFTLVQNFEEIDFKESVQWLSSFFNIDITDLQIVERKSGYVKELKKFINLIKSNKQKQIKEYNIAEEIKTVTKYRNFKIETLQFFKLGFVPSVKLQKKNGDEYVLHNRLVFPVIFNGTQVGMSFRRIKSYDVPKWSHQPAHTDFGNFLYNYDNVKLSPFIIICEGITDVWAFHECNLPAVATFGSHITNEQYKLLLKTGADLILAFDGDEAGKIATKKALEMFKNKANLKQIIFNSFEDPESITREELLERFEYK